MDPLIHNHWRASDLAVGLTLGAAEPTPGDRGLHRGPEGTDLERHSGVQDDGGPGPADRGRAAERPRPRSWPEADTPQTAAGLRRVDVL